MIIDLQHLIRLLEDETLIRQFLHRFVQDTPLLMQHLRASLQKEDWSRLSVDVHTLKSHLQYFNVTASVSLAQQIETEASSSDPETTSLEKLMDELEERIKTILAEVEVLT